MTYSEIHPGETSTRHTHPWEHEIYIISGAGTLICDGDECPITEGDAVLIHKNINHYTTNEGEKGPIRSIDINPLFAAQVNSPSAVSNNAPYSKNGNPVIRNYRDLSQSNINKLIGSKDGAPTCIMLYNKLGPGQSSPRHTHAWEHTAYILEGNYILFCDGKEYPVSEGDAVLVPANREHQWQNPSPFPGIRVNVNPLSAEGSGS
jgi:quercetin dioxygenase-like cupin family protein